MFRQGDRIVYPLYGAGIIEGFEDKNIDGCVQSYYVLTIPIGNLKIMISVDKADIHNVRYVLGRDELLAALAPTTEKCEVSNNWNQRYKDNMNRIRSGDINQVSRVYYSLLLRERTRGLSTAEKKMMTTAKQIILSELILACEVDKPAAEEILQRQFVVVS